MNYFLLILRSFYFISFVVHILIVILLKVFSADIFKITPPIIEEISVQVSFSSAKGPGEAGENGNNDFSNSKSEQTLDHSVQSNSSDNQEQKLSDQKSISSENDIPEQKTSDKPDYHDSKNNDIEKQLIKSLNQDNVNRTYLTSESGANIINKIKQKPQKNDKNIQNDKKDHHKVPEKQKDNKKIKDSIPKPSEKQNKIIQNNKQTKPSASGKKKGFGFGNVMSKVSYSTPINLSENDSATVAQQIRGIWSISIMNLDSIKGIIINVEVVIKNGYVMSVNVIDHESSSSHEHYSLVKESVILAINNCVKLKLNNNLQKGEHKIKFKFIC